MNEVFCDGVANVVFSRGLVSMDLYHLVYEGENGPHKPVAFIRFIFPLRCLLELTGTGKNVIRHLIETGVLTAIPITPEQAMGKAPLPTAQKPAKQEEPAAEKKAAAKPATKPAPAKKAAAPAKKAAELKTAAKATVKKITAPKLNIQIQSPMGGVITPEEITAMVPKEAVDVYVRVDENKLYWVGEKNTGSVDIW